MWLSLTPLEVPMWHKENPPFLCLKLTRSYLCNVSRHGQIQDALVSSLIMALTYFEVFYYFVEMNIANLLYCNWFSEFWTLFLKFCPFLIPLRTNFVFTVGCFYECFFCVVQSILTTAVNKKLSSPQDKSFLFFPFLGYSDWLCSVFYFGQDLFLTIRWS